MSSDLKDPNVPLLVEFDFQFAGLKYCFKRTFSDLHSKTVSQNQIEDFKNCRSQYEKALGIYAEELKNSSKPIKENNKM